MLKTIVIFIALIEWVVVRSQTTQRTYTDHKILYDKIDEVKKNIYSLFQKAAITDTAEESMNRPSLSFDFFNKVDTVENFIETNISSYNSQKVAFLNGLLAALQSFEHSYRAGALKPQQLSNLLYAYDEAIKLHLNHSSIFPVIRENTIEISTIVLKDSAFQTNAGIEESKDFLVSKAYKENPGNILQVLFDNPDVPGADSIIKAVAHTQEENIYTYAQAINTPLGRRIQNINDPLVKIIVRLANMNEGRLYFPFLDNLLTGKITMGTIKNTFGDDNKVKYYQLLVHTAIDYAGRSLKNDTPLAVQSLTKMLRKKAVEGFVNVINRLHDYPDAIRLRVIETLTPQELYYLCIMSENEIYTSSYLKIYYRIFKRMKTPDSYRLIQDVQFDHFKKFIKMAVNYNTIDHFLGKMATARAEMLMKSFPNGLEQSNSLEDAVDVADSYASISDKHVREIILIEVKRNLTELAKKENKRGIVIYNLMQTLFLSLDTSNHIDVSSAFGIPSIYRIGNNFLRDSAGNIIIRQFFYGDIDGIKQFNSFINAYRILNWKIEGNKEWIKISSRKNKVFIFSNRPLDKTNDLDAKAQKHLGIYLEKNDLHPGIVIHRGHSYHLSSTIEQLSPSAKVIFLGSCGGYQQLSTVLKVCTHAHIISTKQEGIGSINQPLIVYLTDLLQSGKDIDWPQVWKKLATKFKHNAKFQDYIPPYKNLGALFIMSYKSITKELKE